MSTDDKNRVQEPAATYGLSNGNVITDISLLDTNKLYTYANYLTWHFKERVELIKGRIYKMSPAPAVRHQILLGNLHLQYGPFFKEKTCKVFMAPFDVRFPTNKNDKNPITVVQPDICIICDLSKLDEQGCNGAPDLIIEILSPSTSVKDTDAKFELYQEHGVAEYWMVDPANNLVDIYVLGENEKYQHYGKFNATKTISPTLFPGLKINLTEVFSE